MLGLTPKNILKKTRILLFIKIFIKTNLNMKIFFLINTLRSGGAQQALVSILENFSLKYFQVFLIVIDRKNKIDSKIYNKNIKIIYLNEKLNNFIKFILNYSRF